MGTRFNNPSLINHQNPICVFNRRQPVGNDKGCFVLHQPLQSLLNQVFRFHIQGRSWFI